MVSLKNVVQLVVAIGSSGAVALLADGCTTSGEANSMPGTCASGTGTLSFHDNSGEAVEIELSDEAGALPSLTLTDGQSQDALVHVGAYSVTVTGQTSHHALLTQSYAVRCDASTQVTVAAEAPLALTVSVMGSGEGSVSSVPSGIECPSANCSSQFFPGTQVTLSAQAQAGSQFSGWSGACAGSATTCSVTMSQAQSVSAQFDVVDFSLEVVLSGNGHGSVSSQPAGIACANGSSPASSCTASYQEGSQVTLTAQAEAGSQFAGWSGGGCSGTGTCVTTISAAETVTAEFTLQSETLTVTRSGSGDGTVTASVGALDCGPTCTASYDYGTAVTLTASAAVGSELAGWSGACSGTGPCVVTMSQAQSVTAQFNKIDYALAVVLSGPASGTVSSQPAGLIDCGEGNTICTANVASGTAVTLTATPADHAVFSGWSGGCSGTGTCVLPSIEAATQVTADFEFEQESLTVSATGAASGPGSGSVTANVGGIDCASSSAGGSGTCSANLDYGTAVILTVNPAAGTSFTWGGACADAGSATTCAVTMSQAQSATVTFSVANVSLTTNITTTGIGSGYFTVSPPDPVTSATVCQTASCVFNYPYLTHITLQAHPNAFCTFAWTAGPCVGSTNPICAFDLTDPATVAVNFNR